MKSTYKLVRVLAVSLILIESLEPVYCCAAVAYVRSTAGYPWGTSTNETAMTTVFGAGNWNDLRYETVNATSLFTVGNSYIYMEGSDLNSDEMELFLTVNLGLIQAWVSNGGSLYLNAAPNEGNGMSFGFGVSNNFNNSYTLASNSATSVNPLHLIFNGPHGATGTSFTGNYFSHATVSGSLTPLNFKNYGRLLLWLLPAGSNHNSGNAPVRPSLSSNGLCP